jgi:hypothetical protein
VPSDLAFTTLVDQTILCYVLRVIHGSKLKYRAFSSGVMMNYEPKLLKAFIFKPNRNSPKVISITRIHQKVINLPTPWPQLEALVRL